MRAHPAPARRPDHPRDHADLRHPRARLLLDARRRQGRSEYPHRPAKIINSHPGVSHNYLRDHEFNLWFTIATPPDSRLGLEGTLEVLQRLTGAESIRQLPTLTMFKINMNLEMEGDTDALAAKVEAVPPRELEPQPYDDFDIAVIRALQGPMEVTERPYDAAAAAVGLDTADLPRPPRGPRRAQDPPPRRRDPLPPPRRLLGERDGRLEGRPRRRRRRRRPDGRGPRHLALLRAPDLRATGPTPSSRWPTAARRRSATRSCSRSPTSTTSTATIAPSSTARPSSRRSASATSRPTTRPGSGSTRRRRSRGSGRQPADSRRIRSLNAARSARALRGGGRS